MNRKVLSLVLALVMVLAFAIPVVAVEGSDIDTGAAEEVIIGENGPISINDILMWRVQNTNGILMKDVKFSVYEQAANGDLNELDTTITLADGTVVDTAISRAYQEDEEFPISHAGNADVAYAYYVGDLKPNATYLVRAELPTLNPELVNLGYTDPTIVLEFNTNAAGQVINNNQLYTLGLPYCPMNIQVLTNGFIGESGVEVAITTLKVDENGYYVLTGREDGYAGNYVPGDEKVTFTTNSRGYIEGLRLVKDYDNNQVRLANDARGEWFAVPEGQMIGVVINGEVKAVISVYERTDDIDSIYNPDTERPWVDPQAEYVPIEGCLWDTLPIHNFKPGFEATIRVWAMTDVYRYEDLDNDNLTKVPAVGSEVTLYENGTENVWDKLTAGDAIRTGKINQHGYVDFTGIPADEVLEYLDPYFSFREITLPYLVKGTNPAMGFYFEDKFEKVFVDDVEDGKIINVFLRVGTDNNAFGRIAGDDRIETALEVAKTTFPSGIETVNGHRTVILANGWSFPDALAGGVLTEAYNAPMLLTRANALPENVEKYITDNGVTRVIVLGGTNSISAAIENELAEKYEVTRLAGETRFDTAVRIGEHLRAQINDGEHAGFLHGSINEGWIFVANGVDFADALTASVPAAMHGAPLLLTNGTGFSAETEAALKSWNPRKVIIIGGENSVSAALASEIRTLTNAPVERYFGENRAITSMKTAEKFFATSSKAYIASGQVFPDALVSTLLASKDKAPILLVNKDSIPQGIVDYIERSVINQFVILGGTDTVSDAVRVQLAELLK